jgi:rhamnosyltransferase
MSNNVCAVIITYHPAQDLAQHIAHLRKQVAGLVIVDNGSHEAERAILRELAQLHSFTLLENSGNLGIGAALNRGIQWAAGDGRFEYVALFDQDSGAPHTFIADLVSCLEQHTARGSVAIVAPRIHNRYTGSTDGGPLAARRGQYLVAQTSGSLMPLRVFNSAGWFKEELFIDYVDYEYCLRVVSAGWEILYCDKAVLSHAPGNSRRETILGIYLGTSLNYSPLRHYYLMRNGVWVLHKYWRQQTRWCAKHACSILKGMIKVFMFEKGRLIKLGCSLSGFIDASRGKLGKHPSHDS